MRVGRQVGMWWLTSSLSTGSDPRSSWRSPSGLSMTSRPMNPNSSFPIRNESSTATDFQPNESLQSGLGAHHMIAGGRRRTRVFKV